VVPSIHILDLILEAQQIIDDKYEFVATESNARHQVVLPIVYKNKRVDIIIINDDVSNYLEA
jgi:hypothetical protein